MRTGRAQAPPPGAGANKSRDTNNYKLTHATTN